MPVPAPGQDPFPADFKLEAPQTDVYLQQPSYFLLFLSTLEVLPRYILFALYNSFSSVVTLTQQARLFGQNQGMGKYSSPVH